MLFLVCLFVYTKQCLGVTFGFTFRDPPIGLKGLYGLLGTEPRLITYKANVLSAI